MIYASSPAQPTKVYAFTRVNFRFHRRRRSSEFCRSRRLSAKRVANLFLMEKCLRRRRFEACNTSLFKRLKGQVSWLPKEPCVLVGNFLILVPPNCLSTSSLFLVVCRQLAVMRDSQSPSGYHLSIYCPPSRSSSLYLPDVVINWEGNKKDQEEARIKTETYLQKLRIWTEASAHNNKHYFTFIRSQAAYSAASLSYQQSRMHLAANSLFALPQRQWVAHVTKVRSTLYAVSGIKRISSDGGIAHRSTYSRSENSSLASPLPHAAPTLGSSQGCCCSCWNCT